MIDSFHFIYPLWLLALIPLGLLVWFSTFGSAHSKAWEKVIDPQLLPLLLQGKDNKSTGFAKWLLGIAWFISVVALADPVWEKIPRPIFQTNSARVLVLDLSNSMLIDDLKPSRLARAHFKIEDILSSEEEGQFGLVVFAGDAFTASPLTRDADTIRALLDVLKPQIMPSQGSRADLGLQKAYELLKQAGVSNGQVLLIADGVSKQSKALEIAKTIAQAGHSISVLGVGTEEGGTLRFSRKKTVEVKLEADALREIARQGGGRYHPISSNNADLKAVIGNALTNDKNEQIESDELNSEDWKSTGPFLILLLLPFAALAFRKGWLLNFLVVATVVGLLQPQPAMAFSLTESWNNLWQTKEQQAHKALKNQEYEKASELSEDPFRKGSAEYKKGDYEKALEDFQKIKGADARYNEANTLAKLKKYQEAVNAYDKALNIQPDMKDAIANKKAIEDLLKKKKHQKQDSKDNKDGKKGEKKEQSDKDNKEGKDKKDKESKEGQSSKDKKESKEGKDGNKKGEKDDKNQFSKANKELDKDKKENQKGAKDKPEKAEADKEKEKSKAQDQKQAEEKSDQKTGKKSQQNEDAQGTKAEADKLSKEEKMAAEQWLRRIPDDPGGLLRRKFLSQYRQRNRQPRKTENPW